MSLCLQLCKLACLMARDVYLQSASNTVVRTPVSNRLASICPPVALCHRKLCADCRASHACSFCIERHRDVLREGR